MLKELNLSSNMIGAITGLSRQVHLQNLYMSDNPIEQFAKIAEIANLPCLKRLTLQCANYGVSPVT